MNKIMYVMPAVAAGMLLVACGGEAPTPAGDAPAADAPAAPAAAPAPVPASSAVPAAYAMPGDATAAGRCSLDALNGKRGETVALPAGGTALFGGWVADAGKNVPTGAMLVLDKGADSYAAPLVAGAHRPDVAAALGSEALAQSGFNLKLDLAGVPAGAYRVVITFAGDAPTYCDLKTSLVLE